MGEGAENEATPFVPRAHCTPVLSVCRRRCRCCSFLSPPPFPPYPVVLFHPPPPTFTMAEEQDQGLASAQQGGFNYQEMDLEDVSACRSTTAPAAAAPRSARATCMRRHPLQRNTRCACAYAAEDGARGQRSEAAAPQHPPPRARRTTPRRFSHVASMRGLLTPHLGSSLACCVVIR
jgi:hypothetical protein